VPHDFVLLGNYNNVTADGHHGYLPRDEAGWYRKTFKLPANWTGGTTWIHFDGVFQAVDIFVNGKFVLRHTSGYLGFDVPLDTASGLLATGASDFNVISIRVDASFGSGHWYEGGGIQRRCYLMHASGPAFFTTDGLFAQTEQSTTTAESASIFSSAEVSAAASSSSELADIKAAVRWTLLGPDGAKVGDCSVTPAAAVDPTAKSTKFGGGPAIVVANPQLWSVKQPTLYTLVAELLWTDPGTESTRLNAAPPLAPHVPTVIDTIRTTIGLRAIDWTDGSAGFKLNDEPIHIRGFSHHSDFGAVGGAVPDRINLFRANALRSVGGNTWRTSHNPYRPELYDIMDATGILVWDENRDFNQMNVQDMEDLVRRDRNHPSVVIWSACNEVECYVTGPANVTGEQMREATKKWDTTRPFSANLNQVSNGSPALNDTMRYLAATMDVEGFSHGSIASVGAARIHAANPGKVMISSECCSCQTQRGEDQSDAVDGITYPHAESQAECMVTCMNYSYPYWDKNPNPNTGTIAGTLGVWTLFDYGGEPGPWPLVSSSFGQFDIAGFAKSASFWYRSLWLAGVPARDPGRPPLPESHVVRISQSWAAPTHHAPPAPTTCNWAAYEKICPRTTGNLQPGKAKQADAQCLTCSRNHQKELKSIGCVGPNVWPYYCNGVWPVTNRTSVQVFSDLPKVQLFLNGDALGPAGGLSNGPGLYAGFEQVHYKPGNLTAVGYTATGAVGASHMLLTSKAAAAVVLSLDVPSVATGTGTALLLDGHDAGMVRATIVDIDGNVVRSASHVVTFEVVSGPGSIIGVHNGDAKSHEAQVSTSRSAYHGLCRAVVKVTHDSASAPQSTLELLRDEIEVRREGPGPAAANGNQGKVVEVLPFTASASAPAASAASAGSTSASKGAIIIKATGPGLTAGQIIIPVSSNAEQHAVLAVAAKQVHQPLHFD